MVCVHTYSESDNALLRYGRLKFSKMAAGHHKHEFYALAYTFMSGYYDRLNV